MGNLQKFFREYQALAAKRSRRRLCQKDEQKRDLWARTFSRVSGRNVAPFFEKWGIPISADAKQELSNLPAWMPYNFPPEN